METHTGPIRTGIRHTPSTKTEARGHSKKQIMFAFLNISALFIVPRRSNGLEFRMTRGLHACLFRQTYQYPYPRRAGEKRVM